MSISPTDPSGSSSPLATQFEPYQSASFQQMRSRLHSLSSSTPHLANTTGKDLAKAAVSLAPSTDVSAGLPSQRDVSMTPSPPVSEGSSRGLVSPGSQTPLSHASDSSASSFTDVDPFERHTTASPIFASRKLTPSVRIRPTLASKRVLSEGDIVPPRQNKRVRVANDALTRKRLAGTLSHSHAAVRSSPIPAESSVAAWRMARKQQRERQLARRNKARVAETKSAATPPSQARQDVLPELRLLSATRTAPIGWSQFSGAAAFAPHMVEMYDERDAKRAPERQRFWPIIDHQLDYTGARMLSLSSASYGPLHLSEPCGKPLFDEPVSPKSGLPLHRFAMPAYTQPIGSSDEDCSPFSPDAPSHRAPRPAIRRPSRQALEAVAKESQRKATIPLSPSATLSAVIDFTRAQASAKHPEPARNAYGQPIHSPPSPPVKCEHVRAPHAPLRIAPCTAPRSRDYFGHWETYLCHFGKESTF